MAAHSDRGLQHSARLTFVDPKGLRNLDLTYPKLGLYKEVNPLETKLNKRVKRGEARLVLTASVLSPAKFSDLLDVGGPAMKQELEDRHVSFMNDGRYKYVGGMFKRSA